MPQEITKATRGERARIEALIAREESRVRSAFRRFLDNVRSDDVRRQVRIALEQGSIESALRVVDAHLLRLGGVVTQVFQNAGIFEIEALARKISGIRPSVAISFDPTYPRAAELMRLNRLAFVRELTRAQRESTRTALYEALRTGEGTVQTARAFRDSIGLTERQRQAVANYRRLLEMGDKAALERGLHDRRFLPEGSPSREAFLDGEPLGAKRIERMVEQYRTRYLQYRAENIARTETLRTVGMARREALEQTLEQAGLPKSAAVRTWTATQDERTRDTHEEMNGQSVPMNEAFQSSSGAQFMFPGDDSLGAPIEEIAQCRCTELYEILDE